MFRVRAGRGMTAASRTTRRNFPNLLLFLLLVSRASLGAENCRVAGRFASIDGKVVVHPEGARSGSRATLDNPLCEGDTVEVGDFSRAAIQLANDMLLRLGPQTSIRLTNVAKQANEQSWVDLTQGKVQSFSRQPQRLRIDAKHLMALIKGTEFLLEVGDEASRLTVLEGEVSVSNARGKSIVAPGQAAWAQTGSAPVLQTVVRPRDAVQWGLYYPPLHAPYDRFAPRGTPIAELASLRQAVRAANGGDFGGALAALDAAPQYRNSIRAALFRLTLLLHVGRVTQAEAEFRQLLQRFPREGSLYALRSVLALVQNRQPEAVRDAELAYRLAPSPDAAIALSYARQAEFRLEEARDVLQASLARSPDHALLWARAGEVWLMLGERRKAVKAAEKSVALDPANGSAEVVLGFCRLAEFHSDLARAAFERAIRTASSDPLAHLGLGLAMIAAGELVEGRREIEAAVALDSNSALLRAYLGKAYFEERRYPLDSQQYQIAKGLDPNDPTAYLYDGILKQSVNRPIQALRDLERSARLNDNRAVYRSRLLLDKDRAARTVSRARALNDLGFTQQGIVESAFSLAMDPANSGAHRYLSDTYRYTGRSEGSRVSELLQAQLFQEININPIQPSLAETNLNIFTSGGPAVPGFSEFTPLFERNMVQLNATGFGGSQGTAGSEGILTGVYDKLSLSAGAYGYHSDGWRQNNGLSEQVYNLFGQYALTPDINVQGEFRKYESHAGDLAFNFDPTNFSSILERKLSLDSARLGARLSWSAHSNLLLSYIYNNVNVTTHGLSSAYEKFEGHQLETQIIHEEASWNFLLGASYFQMNQPLVELGAAPDFSPTRDLRQQPRGYAYSNINWPANVVWTLGLEVDSYSREFSVSRTAGRSTQTQLGVNPKFGLQLVLWDDVFVRFAAFRTVRPDVVNQRSIEPTQVAGFNQFFDDSSGTTSDIYASGVYWHVNRDLTLGGELTWRLRSTTGQSFRDIKTDREQVHSAYLYWSASDRVAVNGTLVYQSFQRLPNRDVSSFNIPITITYFHPNGLFAAIGGQYVNQDVRGKAFTTTGTSSFFLANMSLGYRFPRRFGIFNVSVANLFGTQFAYQDDRYRTFSIFERRPLLTPERTIMAQLTVIF